MGSWFASEQGTGEGEAGGEGFDEGGEWAVEGLVLAV
jgi:hypothetical protein